MQKIVTISDKSYTFASIKTGTGRKMKDLFPDPNEYNVAFVAESLKAGGNADATPDFVDGEFDYFTGDFNKALAAAFEANGFKVEVPKSGEDKPPVEAVPTAESITSTSTSA